MFKIVFLAILIGSSYQAKLWEQCGGSNYNGDRNCESGSRCVVVNQWYSQCQQGSNGGASGTTNQQQSSNNRAPGGSESCSKFTNGKFKTGILFDQVNNVQISNYDYVSIWMNTINLERTSTDFNIWYQGEMIKFCLKNNKIPLFYAYVIAFEARFRKGLEDCDVRSNQNLCTNGADFIRNNKDLLVARYKHHAQKIAAAYGKDKPVVFVMEPDFWQYYGDNKQANGRISGTEMRQLFDRFVSAIKSELPQALISWDVSAWIGEQGMREWWSFFKTAQIDFINTSGGQGNGGSSQIKQNELSWKFMHDLTGKYIIADCGYGVSGTGLNSNCDKWANQRNVNDRINDGVISVTLAKESGVVSRPSVRC